MEPVDMGSQLKVSGIPHNQEMLDLFTDKGYVFG